MGAAEVWLFGSRARGDFRDDSDYDVLAVVPDEAPQEVDSPVAAFRLRRKSRAHADLLTARMSDFLAARSTPNTLSFAVAHEGVRLDV
ncbi:nucleotidyltransferase domain-containing protein [Jannaschia aquimarina]|uniref:nucleotidyltransferase domain-containing protein n=1 Tax=Jannaschia aquimarina TaxID=935700 RepID=UPI000B79322D